MGACEQVDLDVSRVECKQREKEREMDDEGGRKGVKSPLRVIRKKSRPHNVIHSWDPLTGWGEGWWDRGVGFNGSTLAFV